MDSLETVGDRVKHARSLRGLSQSKLADHVGVKYQTIQDLENNKSKGTKHILALARALGVTPEWLQYRQGPGPRDAFEAPKRVRKSPAPTPLADDGREYLSAIQGHVAEWGGKEYAQIPVYDIRFGADMGPAHTEEALVGFYPFEMDFLRSFTDAPLPMVVGFQAGGDSMAPTIFDRDWCFADLRRRNLAQPGIYAIMFEGEGLLKRATQHIETKAVTLISDNDRYPAMTINNPERLMVVGRIFASIRRH